MRASIWACSAKFVNYFMPFNEIYLYVASVDRGEKKKYVKYMRN